MEKYGFVYIWYDRKHKRYYVGCRWGNINDGYICSSNWMKKSFMRRPQDFKRRVLEYVYTNRTDLYEREYEWLKLIKKEELGKKYYNIRNHHFSHWSTDPIKVANITQKSSKRNKGRIPWNKNKKGQYTEKQLEKIGKWIRSEETRQKLSTAKLGKPLKKKKRILTDDIRARMGHMKGKKVDRAIVKIRTASIKKLKWITNGVVDKRTSKVPLPEGFSYGRTHNNPPKWWENTTCTSSIDD